MRGPKAIYGLVCGVFVKAQLRGEYLGNIYEEYLCGFRIMCGPMRVFL